MLSCRLLSLIFFLVLVKLPEALCLMSNVGESSVDVDANVVLLSLLSLSCLGGLGLVWHVGRERVLRMFRANMSVSKTSEEGCQKC